MRNICVKKGLVVGVILLFLGVSVTSSIGISNSIDDTTAISKGLPKIGRYENCHIYTLSCNAGRAYLFPGFLASTKKHGTYVNNSSGFGIGDFVQWTGYLYINGEKFTDWRWMIIKRYTGELKNYFEYGPGFPDRAYILDGFAELVIICYNN